MKSRACLSFPSNSGKRRIFFNLFGLRCLGRRGNSSISNKQTNKQTTKMNREAPSSLTQRRIGESLSPNSRCKVRLSTRVRVRPFAPITKSPFLKDRLWFSSEEIKRRQKHEAKIRAGIITLEDKDELFFGLNPNEEARYDRRKLAKLSVSIVLWEQKLQRLNYERRNDKDGSDLTPMFMIAMAYSESARKAAMDAHSRGLQHAKIVHGSEHKQRQDETSIITPSLNKLDTILSRRKENKEDVRLSSEFTDLALNSRSRKTSTSSPHYEVKGIRCRQTRMKH